MAYEFAQPTAVVSSGLQPRKLSPAVQRALAEAETSRRAAEVCARPMPKEFQGPKGPEPTRYDDWENRGIAYDF
jgi:hypothetical protein